MRVPSTEPVVQEMCGIEHVALTDGLADGDMPGRIAGCSRSDRATR